MVAAAVMKRDIGTDMKSINSSRAEIDDTTARLNATYVIEQHSV